MTPTDLSMLVLLAAALLFAGVRQLVEADPDPVEPDPVASYSYEAPFGQPGAPLPHRPEGMRALKAEIAHTPPGYVPAPQVHLRTGPKHVDWLDTREIELRWNEYFAGMSNDGAVQRVWVGAGHVD